jgi:hypothetical protein
MKKSFLTVAAVIACAVVAVSCSTEKKATPFRAGIVNHIVGEVYVVSADKTKIVPVIGTPVKSGMTIATLGKKSLCEVYFGENVIKVFGDSELEIDTLSFNKETKAKNSSFHLWQGRVFVRIVNKLFKDDSFSVKTPTSVAAVRGTEFYVTQNNAKSNIACLDGKVEVNNPSKKSSKPVLVEDNQEVMTAKGKDPKKNTIPKEKKKTLKKDSEVQPMTEENKTTIAGLEEGDKGAVDSIQKKFEEMKKKGDSASKDSDGKKEKSKIDLFFFKSKD